nr:hypothetical protein [uncultured Pedobacter sp.]
MELTNLLNDYFSRFVTLEKTMALWLVAGKAVGLIGAYVYIFKKFASKMLNGGVFNMEDFAYPIFIAFVLSAYTPIAKGIPQLFGASIFETNGTSQLMKYTDFVGGINERQKEYESNREGKSFKITPQTQSAATEFANDDPNAVNGNYSGQIDQGINATDMLLDPKKFVSSIMYSVVSFVLVLIAQVCMAVLFLIAKMYLIFLYVFGPISIGMSLIPGFENSITNWFQKMLQYSLWVPIANTISELTINSFKSFGENSVLGMEPAVMMSALIMSSVFMIVSFLCVPKITSNILSIGGGQSSTKAMAAQAAKMLITKGV